MAKVDQSPQDVGRLLERVQAVAGNLTQARSHMLGSGVESIEIDISTADRFIRWLEDWAEKVELTGRRAAKKKDAAAYHSKMEDRKKAKPQK